MSRYRHFRRSKNREVPIEEITWWVSSRIDDDGFGRKARIIMPNNCMTFQNNGWTNFDKVTIWFLIFSALVFFLSIDTFFIILLWTMVKFGKNLKNERKKGIAQSIHKVLTWFFVCKIIVNTLQDDPDKMTQFSCC